MPVRDDQGDLDRDILDIIPERFDADPDSRRARKSALTRLILSVSLLVLAIMAVGVVARHILFGEAPRDHQISVPVIRADDKPIKVKPDDRGGMDVPNQDKLIYERLAAKKDEAPPERLLPPPEAAQSPPAAAAKPAPPAAITAAATPSAPPATKAAPSPAATGAPPSPAKPTEPATPAKPTVPAAAAAPANSPGKGGGWVVQLGAVRSEAEAKSEWARLKNMHKEQLNDLTSDIVRVDLGAKGIFWRVRGGPLDEAQARLLCADLTKQNQGCIIARQ
jgi:cell division septation protein DedD